MALKELVVEVEGKAGVPRSQSCSLLSTAFWLGWGLKPATGHTENAGAVIVPQELSVGMSHVFENTIVHHQSNHLSVTEGFMQL